jgi:nitrate reductase gamma subunit
VSGLSFFVLGILPYLTAAVFVVAMADRLRGWAKAPQPGKMTLFPAPSSTGKGVLAEALFFPSLFKGDRFLWAISWLFHVTLALVALGHLRVFTGLIDSALVAMGMSPEGIDKMSSTSGGAAGVILLVTGLLLLGRRLAVRRAREISGAGDFFALFLLVAIIASGDIMRFGGAHFDLEQTRLWTRSLLVFSPEYPGGGAFLIHALLAQILIIYIPFSKILHFGGIFFTQTLIKRS